MKHTYIYPLLFARFLLPLLHVDWDALWGKQLVFTCVYAGVFAELFFYRSVVINGGCSIIYARAPFPGSLPTTTKEKK